MRQRLLGGIVRPKIRLHTRAALVAGQAGARSGIGTVVRYTRASGQQGKNEKKKDPPHGFRYVWLWPEIKQHSTWDSVPRVGGMFVEPGPLVGIVGPDGSLHATAALAAHQTGGTLVVRGLGSRHLAAAGQKQKGGKQKNQTHGLVMAKCPLEARPQNNVSFYCRDFVKINA